ncbi:MAG: methyltransferase domain-containing protein [Planctomycetales bacterium]
MPQWDADQYLRFAEERTRPCRDLVARIDVSFPRRMIDLGCGPGNSTQVLSQRWPAAELTGLDSSEEMVQAARRDHSQWESRVGDISSWASSPGEPFDIVFSNAALQWVPDHGALFPSLLSRVAVGGALAVQVPCNLEAPAHVIARRLAAREDWRPLFPPDGVREWHVHDADFYYDRLAPGAQRVDFWTTEYLHVMPGVESVVEWYKGTGLRPYHQALASPADQERFLQEYRDGLREAYSLRADGSLLFPFQRLFMIAYRK